MSTLELVAWISSDSTFGPERSFYNFFSRNLLSHRHHPVRHGSERRWPQLCPVMSYSAVTRQLHRDYLRLAAGITIYRARRSTTKSSRSNCESGERLSISAEGLTENPPEWAGARRRCSWLSDTNWTDYHSVTTDLENWASNPRRYPSPHHYEPNQIKSRQPRETAELFEERRQLSRTLYGGI